ncbi:MAG: hypothetical protein R3305_03125 [Gammaproteobacteria bacterium]|nr:hypothetical protein [Gammaproteobacteria bacterium]
MGDSEATALLCYRCGASLAALTLPLSRLDLCPSCSVELHVCRMCRYYAPRKPKGCIEDDAEEVKNKTGRNFCDYFEPSYSAHDGSERSAADQARAKLDALFEPGGTDAASGSDGAAKLIDDAESLFKK